MKVATVARLAGDWPQFGQRDMLLAASINSFRALAQVVALRSSLSVEGCFGLASLCFQRFLTASV